MDLFSHAGVVLRDRGMAIAEAAQERCAPGWSDRYYAAIVRRARAHPTVHRDDVALDFTEKPEHFNAAGAPWQRAVRDGVLGRPTEFRASRDRKKNAHNYPVYPSLIYRGPHAEVDE
jgi:hypothetical protein